MRNEDHKKLPVAFFIDNLIEKIYNYGKKCMSSLRKRSKKR